MEGLLDAAHAISKVTKAACYFHCIAKAYCLSNASYNLDTVRNGLKCVCFPSAGLNEKGTKNKSEVSHSVCTRSLLELTVDGPGHILAFYSLFT